MPSVYTVTYILYIRIYVYVTGFWKTNQIVALGLFHFISPANGYTHILAIHSAIIKLG